MVEQGHRGDVDAGCIVGQAGQLPALRLGQPVEVLADSRQTARCLIDGSRGQAGQGWLAGQVELPEFTEERQRDEFIRGAVAGCKPVAAESLVADTVGRALFTR